MRKICIREWVLCAVYPDARNPFAHLDLATEGWEAWTVREVWMILADIVVFVSIYFVTMAAIAGGFDAWLLLPFLAWLAAYVGALCWFVPRLGKVVLVTADDVGDHVAHLRVLQAARLLERGELVLEARLELAGDPAFLLDQFPAGAFALLDLLGDALKTCGQLFGILGHQLADFRGTVGAHAIRRKDCRPHNKTAAKPNQHQPVSIPVPRAPITRPKSDVQRQHPRLVSRTRTATLAVYPAASRPVRASAAFWRWPTLATENFSIAASNRR